MDDMTRTETLQGAARVLRAVLSELPPASPIEKAFARRVEGAVIALESFRFTATEHLR